MFNECPNSGEDSDEDVITDYLSSAQPDCSPRVNGLDSSGSGGGIIVSGEPGYNNIKDEGGGNAIMSGTMGQQQQQQQAQQPGSAGQSPGSTCHPTNVPIISVTPHCAPGLAKHYPVL
ncbi:hypothetical protein QAD02_015077, partial [Eretmocerus hayati]